MEQFVDENGRLVESPVKKIVEPRPEREDFTRIRIGPEPGDYTYLDPASLFAAERYVQARRNGEKPAAAGKGHRKALRDLAEVALEWWPPQGHVLRWTTWEGVTTFPATIQDFADALGATEVKVHPPGTFEFPPLGPELFAEEFPLARVEVYPPLSPAVETFLTEGLSLSEPDLQPPWMEDELGDEDEGLMPLPGGGSASTCEACGDTTECREGWWPTRQQDAYLCEPCWETVS